MFSIGSTLFPNTIGSGRIIVGRRNDVCEMFGTAGTMEMIIMSEIDPFDELIDEAKRGESPPPFGAMEFTVYGSPASIQSSTPIREAYRNSIRDVFNELNFILMGELMLEVTWSLPAKSRFETDAKADIDNCIKPIIDAFTGPNGLFIDDCQIKGLYICWRHVASGDERLDFKFEFDPDDFRPKDSLGFVRLEKGLCVPVDLRASAHLNHDSIGRYVVVRAKNDRFSPHSIP